MDTLRQVRIFQDCEPGLLEALVLKLKLQVSMLARFTAFSTSNITGNNFCNQIQCMIRSVHCASMYNLHRLILKTN